MSTTITRDAPVDRPEHMIERAREGRFSKDALALLLNPQPRRAFLDACAEIEADYTRRCGAAGDPCLEAGCSLEEERCLQPLLEAGTEYHKACGAAWATLFADPANRISYWRANAPR